MTVQPNMTVASIWLKGRRTWKQDQKRALLRLSTSYLSSYRAHLTFQMQFYNLLRFRLFCLKQERRWVRLDGDALLSYSCSTRSQSGSYSNDNLEYSAWDSFQSGPSSRRLVSLASSWKVMEVSRFKGITSSSSSVLNSLTLWSDDLLSSINLRSSSAGSMTSVPSVLMPTATPSAPSSLPCPSTSLLQQFLSSLSRQILLIRRLIIFLNSPLQSQTQPIPFIISSIFCYLSPISLTTLQASSLALPPLLPLLLVTLETTLSLLGSCCVQSLMATRVLSEAKLILLLECRIMSVTVEQLEINRGRK